MLLSEKYLLRHRHDIDCPLADYKCLCKQSCNVKRTSY